ncbi:unnamed protein product [Adineta steineri]|uniref:Exportin-7/Ran-binding protein 17 TPR repeats domain-containing protein n=1 Tax=Adineta steineri TaxID=433720 RepID=A0A818HCS2_9BILA|nr:unnamed protein product [Adineta steineri]CAF3502398.1 unnamed protein product [Adineta steineri]
MDALEIEHLCSQLYSSGNNEQMRLATQRLETFINQTNCLSQCRLLLDRAVTPYTQFFGATTLIKHFNSISNQPLVSFTERYELRTYILEYLYKHNSSLAQFVLAELVKLYSRLTKNSWFDLNPSTNNENYPFQTFTDDLLKFQNDPSHFSVALQILIGILSEMSVPNDEETTARAFTKHRKICISFRDTKLIDIYLFACQYLRDVIVNQKKTLGLPTELNDYPKTIHTAQLQPDYYIVVEKLLTLALSCLTYDFLGTGSSIHDVDISDEHLTLQVPIAWHDHIIDGSFYRLFFSYYFLFSNTTLVPIAISCLVQLSSVRRSLLNTNERLIVFNLLTYGIRSILEQPGGLLSDEKSLHEFCRLIARLKSNAQLHELVRIDNYPLFMERLFRFTIDHLLSVHHHRQYHLSPNTLHYILSFWSKIVAFLSHSSKLSDSDDSSTLHLLDIYVPQIVSYYIQSRLDALNNDDILYTELFDNDQTILQQQLDMISIMSRLDYNKTCVLLCNCFDDIAQQYQQAANSETVERRFTFLIYVLGCVIGARGITLSSLSMSNDEQDLFDGELVVRVLQLMTYIQQKTSHENNQNTINTAITTIATDKKDSTPYSERLELAVLFFFEQFRKQYVGDHGRSDKIYQVLFKHLGIADEEQLLSIFVKKLFTNLQYSIISDKLIERTVGCFSDLTHGYQSVRKLVKLDPIQYFINNHTQDLFPFLHHMLTTKRSHNSNISISSWSRLRTTFYTAIGRMLMHDFRYDEDDDDRAEAFMKPFTTQCTRLVQIFKEFPEFSLINPGQFLGMNQFNPTLASLDEIQSLIIGITRDLRGLCSSLLSKQAYNSFFDWLYPAYLPLFLKALYVFYDRMDVYNPLLKFFHELSSNRQERLVFDSTKASAYLLFRETSNLLYIFQTKTLVHVNNTIPESDGNLYYKSKLKPITTCLKIIQTCLVGNYVNFGVFHLYSDPCFDNCLQVFISILTSIKKSDLLSYPKLTSAYFSLIETLSIVKIDFLANLSLPLFGYVLETITEGFLSHEQTIQNSCCVYLDTFLSYVFRSVKKNSASTNLMANVQEYEGLFRQILVNLLNGIIYAECKNIYTVSKPLLGLILLNENKFFTEIKQQLLYGHTQVKQAVLSTALDNLMTGIDRTLTESNKENFTQNITQFRSDIQDSLNVTDTKSSSTSVPSSSSIISTNIPVTIAVSNLIPSSSTTAPVEELMTL